MKLLADENVPRPSVDALRADGHDIVSVGDQSGAADSAVLARAHREDRLLITFDRDFGALVFRQGEHGQPGVIYLRFRPTAPEEPAEVLRALFAHADVQLRGAFTVVDRDRVRQRRLPSTR